MVFQMFSLYTEKVMCIWNVLLYVRHLWLLHYKNSNNRKKNKNYGQNSQIEIKYAVCRTTENKIGSSYRRGNAFAINGKVAFGALISGSDRNEMIRMMNDIELHIKPQQIYYHHLKSDTRNSEIVYTFVIIIYRNKENKLWL